MLIPTDRVEVSLRRFSLSKAGSTDTHYHSKSVVIDQRDKSECPKLTDNGNLVHGDLHDHADPRWPTACDCGYQFTGEDEWQFSPQSLYRVGDTDVLTTLGDAPVGSMWYADWFESIERFRGPDGKVLVVKCPGNHDWIIDSQANNCTLPNDTVHKCWVRHGVPPNVTVDKNGHTCAAGAGSIQVPNWHGFLINGYLVENPADAY
jgi:hypothetical protein